MGNADTEDGELNIMNIFGSFDFPFFSLRNVYFFQWIFVIFLFVTCCIVPQNRGKKTQPHLPSLARSSLGFSRVTVQLALS